MQTKFLLLLGVSGVGKSTIIGKLRKIDSRFKYISPYITRILRSGEMDKICVTDDAMDEMDRNGEFLIVNKKYGVRYATPLKPIVEALSGALFPILDWPINRLNIMTWSFSGRLTVVYLAPPSMEELERRLSKDSRDENRSRIREAREELEDFYQGKYADLYDLCITTQSGEEDIITKNIYEFYLKSL
jgi:guanylate kinase